MWFYCKLIKVDIVVNVIKCLTFNFRKHSNIAKLINYGLIVDASYLPRAITRRRAVVINFMRLWRFFYHFITRLGVSRRVSSADIRRVAARSLTHRLAASSCIAVRCTSHSARLRSVYREFPTISHQLFALTIFLIFSLCPPSTIGNTVI